MPSINLIAFPGAGNLPFYAAAAQGLFERYGISVALETTPSSMYQAQKLVAGEFDLACTAVDNVIAYQEGAGEVALDREPDLFILMGATQIELSFVVSPDIESYADLAGKSLAMDALTTGFAFALYQMLENAGLDPEATELVSVGSTPSRWESVRDGEHAGTLLIEPFTSMARAAGFRVLESSLDTFEHYQGQVFTASRSWANAHKDSVTSFIQGYLDALDWVLDPINRDAAEALLIENLPAVNEKSAGPVLNKLVSPRTGLSPLAAIDMAGLETVLELRSRFAPSKKRLTDPVKYLDLSYYEEAVAARADAR
ncbi:MAG: PhnD/SsuA/transferrin family substrate-binding protein [Alphaproteobacteria bacterium]|nr:PhnD/SsuA/transferrin family substrate-binding protein [Alphaproteobacteria bacterium]